MPRTSEGSPWAPWLATLPAEGLDGSAFGTSADVLAAAAATRRAENPGAAPADAYTAWMASDDAGGEPPAKSYEEEIEGLSEPGGCDFNLLCRTAARPRKAPTVGHRGGRDARVPGEWSGTTPAPR